MEVMKKKNTWVKSCKESATREMQIFKMVESLADDAKVEDGDRGRIGKPCNNSVKKKMKKKKLVHSWKQNVAKHG